MHLGDLLLMDPDSLYGVPREEANWRRKGGQAVGVRRQGRPARQLFKESIYGSSEAALAEAKTYRDAVAAALPPRTDQQQAVKLRTNNKSGISGVRHGDDCSGVYWGATLLTHEARSPGAFR